MSKMYLPSDLISNSYNYEYTNDYIVVHKYTNRHQDQWGNWSSDCVRVYPNFDYNVSNVYSCSENFTTYLTKEDFTSDFYYRVDIVNILLIFMILSIVIVIVPYKIIKKLFGGRI